MDALIKSFQRVNLGNEYSQRNELLALEGRRLTYPNQQEAANKIIEHFANGKLAVVLVAQPGVGKTGVALETAYRMCTHADDNLCVLTKDIHTHSGMNDKSWTEQYMNSMLTLLKNNITHRSKIKNDLEKLSRLENGLVVTDECHIAAGMRMTQSNVLKEAGLLSINNLEAKRNKLVNISATPEGVLVDMDHWGSKAALVILQPGPLYKGFQVMIDEQRILDAPLLNTEAEVETLLRFFEDRYATSSKRFFPFRGLSPGTIQHIYNIVIRLGWTVIRHDSNETIEDVDAFMGTAPSTHTIILIKDFWRASKRVIRTHIGGSYEKPPSTRNTSATAQGLTARFCDTFDYTGDWLNPNLRPIHYCDLGAIEQYLEWYNNGCNYRIANYTSSKIKSKGGNIRKQPTLVHHSNVDGLIAVAPPPCPIDKCSKPISIIKLEPTDIIPLDNKGSPVKGSVKAIIMRKQSELYDMYKDNKKSYYEWRYYSVNTEKLFSKYGVNSMRKPDAHSSTSQIKGPQRTKDIVTVYYNTMHGNKELIITPWNGTA